MQVLSPPPPPPAVSEPLIPEIGATRFPTSFTQTDVHREDLTKTDTQKKTTNDKKEHAEKNNLRQKQPVTQKDRNGCNNALQLSLGYLLDTSFLN